MLAPSPSKNIMRTPKKKLVMRNWGNSKRKFHHKFIRGIPKYAPDFPPTRESRRRFFCWCFRVSKNELNLNKVQINYLTASACQVRESGLVKVVLKSMLRKSLSLGSRLNSTNEGSDKRILTRWEVCHCLYVEIRSECSTNFWSLSGSLCQEWWMLPIFWTKIEIPKCFKAF